MLNLLNVINIAFHTISLIKINTYINLYCIFIYCAIIISSYLQVLTNYTSLLKIFNIICICFLCRLQYYICINQLPTNY